MRRLLTVYSTAIGVGLMALLLCASCAPVGDPPPGDPSANASGGPQEQPQGKSSQVALLNPDTSYKARIENVLEQVKNRELLTTHSFWTVFHAILGNGLDCAIRDPITNKTENTVDYISRGGQLRGLRFIPSPSGVDVQIGPQFDGQGHPDQFIAEMAQLGLPKDHKFRIEGKDYAFEDFLKHAKAVARVREGAELTWTIVAVGQVYGTDCSWTNNYGEQLHYEDLVRFELNQPVELGACGGTHRLFGLTWALFLRCREGHPPTGLWKEVALKLKRYEDMARQYQNPGGMFSTDYFKGPGNVPDTERQLASSGHILEWLALWLPDHELKSPWMQEAALAVANLILENERRSLDGGALYHAAHGLHLYYSRVYGGPADPRLAPLPLPRVRS